MPGWHGLDDCHIRLPCSYQKCCPLKHSLPHTMSCAKKRCNNSFITFPRGRKSFYDEAGCMISTGKDLCDCLMRDCSGCFYPCENCRSLKCGKECRVNRRWHYSNTEVEGGPTRTFPQLPLPSKPNGLWTYCSAIAKCARCVAATLSELLGSCNTRLVQQQ